MSTLTVLQVPRRPRSGERGELDPSTVFFEDFEPGRGQMTVVCWGRAWTHYWGAMGGNPTHDIRSFVLKAWTGYIVGKLMDGAGPILKRAEKREEEWLTDIVEAIKDELRRTAVAKEPA
nr:hypothetical protein [uncultured Roseateles sp.]